MTISHHGRGLRVIAAIVVTVSLAACGGDDNDEATTTTSEATTTTTQDPTVGITAAYETFFDGANTERASALAVLENPDVFGPLYDKALKDKSFADLLKQVKADVVEVRVTGATTAELDYNLLLNGKPATEGTFLGRAVLEDGTWKVAGATFCNLLALGNPAYSSDPACKV